MQNHSFKSWFLATRPWSFPASAMPVVVAVAYLFWCGYEINWLISLWTLLNVVVFHAAGNTWSDYFDYKRGVDREDTVGGVSITSGEFAAGEIRSLAMVLLAVAVVSGFFLLAFTGMPVLYFGLAGAFFTLLYPWLKYHALGDVDIFLTYSLLPLLGTSYVATGAVRPESLWLSVPIGLITVGILHINNMRDIEHDARAGIKTFAMLAGKRVSAVLYCLEMVLPFVWVCAGIVCGVFPVWVVAVLLALKPAVGNCRSAFSFLSVGSKALVGIDEKTAMLQLMFSLLLSISLLVAALV
ncbi:MAG: prenyltransferase [Bacteroidaceae bacterium]|nr:prenyltransferase [Bacteroidaceae bacterium]